MQKKRVHILICFVFVSKPENIIFLFVCFEMLSPQGGKFPFLPLLLQVYMFTSIIKHLAELVAQCFPVAKHAYILYMYDGQFVKTTLNLFLTSFTNPINPNSFSSTFLSDSKYDSPVEYDTQQSKGILEKVNTFLSTNCLFNLDQAT